MIMVPQHIPTSQKPTMVGGEISSDWYCDIFNGGNPPVTNPQLLSLLSKPHHGGIMTGGNMLGNHDDNNNCDDGDGDLNLQNCD